MNDQDNHKVYIGQLEQSELYSAMTDWEMKALADIKKFEGISYNQQVLVTKIEKAARFRLFNKKQGQSHEKKSS